MHTRLLGHSARLSMVLALVGATLFGAAPRARAAIVDATVSNLAVVPATGSPWRTLTTSFDWCVPDGSQPGDSFVVGLPDVLGTWPSTFPLESTAGTVVADGVINAGPPSYLTVTLTDAVAGQSNVCGTVELQSQARNGAGVAGTTRRLDFNTPTGVQSATVSFDELGPGGTNPGASKGGWFSSVDQCRTDGTRCVNYAISTMMGPTDSDVRIVDNPPAGQDVDCSALSLYWRDLEGNWVRGLNDTRWTLNSCSATGLDITVHGLLDGLRAVVQFPVSVSPSPGGATTYTNDATVAVAGQAPVPVSAKLVSNRAVGTAIGSAIVVDKHDAAGNKADTAEDAAELPDGSTGIEITYTNRSLGDLDTIVVEDTTTVGSGNVEGLSCDFSQAVAGAPTSGLTWAGPWPTGTTFTCTGRLTGVTPEGHRDLATLAAFDPSGAIIRGKDAYNAVRPVVSIGDHVWWDANADGLQQAGEQPAEGVVVNLLDDQGRVIGTDTTTETGFYSFQGLATASVYSLQFVAPDGATWTTRAAGDGAADSDVAADGTVSVTTPRDGLNDHDTPDDPTLDAGLVPVVTPTPTPVVTPTPTPVVTSSPSPSSSPSSSPVVTPSPSSSPAVVPSPAPSAPSGPRPGAPAPAPGRTLPSTGSDVEAGLMASGLAALLAGAALVAADRRRR